MPLTSKHSVYLAAFTVAVIWGVATPVIKLVVAEVPPIIAVFVRFTIAAFAFIPFLWTAEKRCPIMHKDLPKLLVLAFLGSTAALVFAFEGIARTTVLDAAIIVATVPIVEALASSLRLHEKFTKPNIFGFIIAFIGTLIVIAQPFGDPTREVHQRFFGNVLVFLHVIAWVLFTIGSKEEFKRYEAAHLTGLTLAVGMITTAPLAFLAHLKNPMWLADITWVGLAGILYLAIFSSIIAYTLWEWALSKLSAGKLGIFLFITPLVAVALAVPLLSEQPTPIFIIGALLTLIGIALALKGKHHTLSPSRHSHKL